MTSSKKELDDLVEQALAFLRGVDRAESVETPPSVETALVAIEQTLKVEERPPRTSFAPMNWPASEREEIKRRVAKFKAHQLRMQNERDAYFVRTMMQARATSATSPNRE